MFNAHLFIHLVILILIHDTNHPVKTVHSSLSDFYTHIYNIIGFNVIKWGIHKVYLWNIYLRSAQIDACMI